MSTLAHCSASLARVRHEILAAPACADWSIALLEHQPHLHGRLNMIAFALALHAPTVRGWLYVAHRFAHVGMIPRRSLAYLQPDAPLVIERALTVAEGPRRAPLARWLTQLVRTSHQRGEVLQ